MPTVPLAGHTRGHAGVAVRTGDRWLPHAGDAYFSHTQLDPAAPHSPRNEDEDEDEDEVTVFSAHDPVEYHRLAAPEAAIDQSG
jgi:glyoxylase-like metal-dependent hydrolase (beta-lactamase superfamily II)